MRTRSRLAVVITGSVTAVVLALTPGTAFADTDEITASEVAAVLAKAGASGLVLNAVASASDTDSAAQTASVDIPSNPTEGVKLSIGNGRTLTVALPNSSKSGRGKKTPRGAVVYSGRGGSANALIPTEYGAAQFLTAIKNRHAPSSYAYSVGVNGGRIELVGRGAVVYDREHNPVVLVAAPWARDANDTAVPTYFTTDGTTLTQHIAHNVRGVAYPVVADPWWIPAAIFVGGWVAGNWMGQAVDYFVGCGSVLGNNPCRVR